MRLVIRYFLQGCLVIVPSALTAYVVYALVRKVDELLRAPVPGLGIVLTLVGITAVGALTSNVLGRALLKRVEKLIGRVPLVRLLYTTLRDFVGAFLGEERSFDRPALVSLTDDGGAKALGFITREDLGDFALQDHVLVYFPQSYNFAGNVLVFPKRSVTPLDVDATQFMALVVSGGVVKGRAAGESARPSSA